MSDQNLAEKYTIAKLYDLTDLFLAPEKGILVSHKKIPKIPGILA